MERDFHEQSAWRLAIDGEGRVTWTSGEVTLDRQPAASFMQRLGDWFLAHLPIEGEM